MVMDLESEVTAKRPSVNFLEFCAIFKKCKGFFLVI